MENEKYLQGKYPELNADDIEFLIQSAQSIYKSITKYEEVKPEHQNWILRCCIELVERDGYTGASAYSESNVSVTFDSSQVSYGLRRELPNNATCYDSKGNVIK